MIKIIQRSKVLLVLFISFCLFSIKVNASHVSGGSVTYRCLGADSFEITLTLFRDCIGMGLSSQEPIYYYSSSCGDTVVSGMNLSRISIKNVSQICSKDSLNSSCVVGSGGYQGYEEHTYKGILKLSKQCNDWLVYYTTAYNFYARNKAITNLANTGSYSMFAIIDNTNNKCNNSPYYMAPYPIAYVCLNQPTTYSFGAVETDGDSLAFDLYPALNYNLNPMPYNAPWSDTVPIDGIVNDPITGLLSFTPTTLGIFVVNQRIREYDTLGNFIGATMRDVQIVVENCNPNIPPNANSGIIQNLKSPAIKTGNYSAELAEGDSLSFSVIIDDPDSTDTLSLKSNITAQLPGATFSFTGTNPVTAYVKWKVPTGTAGSNKSFSITARDNYCPISAQQTYVYNISIIGDLRAGPDSTICNGQSIQLNAVGGRSFTWTVASGDPIVIGTNFSCDTCFNPIASPSITTLYKVVSDLISNNIDTVTITVKPVLNATITQVGPFCESEAAVNLSAVDVGGIWLGTGITDSIVGTFNPDTAGFGTHTITYRINSQCGDTDTVNIFVDSLRNATITQAGPFCESASSVTLKAVHTGGVWSGNGVSVGGVFAPNTAGPGTHTITYSITGVCSDIDTMKIRVDSTMDATITPVGPFCITDASYNLQTVDAVGIWSGTGITDTIVGTFDPATAKIGSHTITHSISGVCSATDTEIITVTDSTDATITPAGPFCETEQQQTLVAATSGGVWSGNGITDSTNGYFSPSIAGVGTYVITYAIGGMCGDTDTVSIVIDSLVDATISPAADLCPDASPITLTTVDAGGIWSGAGMDLLNGSFDPTKVVSGTYNIIYTITSVCSDTDTLVINVLFPPSIDDITTTDESCMGCDGTATAIVSSGTPPYSYQWGTTNKTTNPAIALCSGLESITVTDINNCTANSSFTINQAPAPTAFFGASPQPTTTTKTTISFTDLSTGNDISAWNWTFYDTAYYFLETRTTSDPNYTFPRIPGIYPVNLLVYDKDGCSDDTTLYVIILEDFAIYVPNAFTPNDDFVNDIFGPLGTGIDKDTYSFYIFNRWGELIFSTKEFNDFWDGTYQGKMVQDGVYIWKIILSESTPERTRHELTGSVTVIK